MTDNEIVERIAQVDLSRLARDADEAAEAARPHCPDDAVNWGDIGCMSAERFETDDGYWGLRVHFEEAAPDCPQFHGFVVKYLKERGYDDVEVVTEW